MRGLTPLLVGVVGVTVIGIAAFSEPGAAAQAWLAAELFWIGLPLGALFMRLAFGLIGGPSGLSVAMPLARISGTMPLLSLFFLPVMVGVARIYPWTQTGAHGWLAPGFFALRAILYLVLWNGIALLLQRSRGGATSQLPPGIAWPCLIILFGTASLASFDWIMSLEPRWTSTVFGLLVTEGWVLSALAMVIVIAVWSPLAMAPEQLDALARLLLALVYLWAYLAVVQLVVIWESDLRQDIPWYLKRANPGWEAVAAAFVLLQFILPFLVLLWEPLRRNDIAVSAAAAAIILGHLLETWWLTAPDFGNAFGWLEPLAAIAIGGCVIFIIEGGLDRMSLSRAGAAS